MCDCCGSPQSAKVIPLSALKENPKGREVPGTKKKVAVVAVLLALAIGGYAFAQGGMTGPECMMEATLASAEPVTK